MNKEIVVLGSLNVDLVITADRLPQAGETLFGRDFTTQAGGKGANQAVAAARAGGRVAMIGRVGDDDYGRRMCANLRENGVNIAHVAPSSHSPTGVAMILVESSGENRIIVIAGANGDLTVGDVDKGGHLSARAAALVLQMEIPWDVNLYALQRAHRLGIPTILNLAPAYPVPDEILRKVDYLILNESEAELLSRQKVSDVDSAERAAAALRQRGAGVVIITLGSRGALLAAGDGRQYFPPHRVDVVDTTAAGDAFVGYFVTSLVETGDLTRSLALANAAGALTVTKHGAQVSLPARDEVERLAAAGAVRHVKER